MLENFFKNISQEVDKKETPSSMAPTLKKEIELKSEDLVPVVEPSEKAPTMPILPAEHVTELVEDKDIHGPLEPTMAETLHKAEAVAAQMPTVRTEPSMELKASEAQTFKTGETIAKEEAVKAATEQQYQAQVAQEKVTLRKMAEGYMEYDAIHSRVTEWLKTLDEMLATPQPNEELIKLKADALKAKEKIESQLNLEQYGIAKSEAGATPFTVEVPAEWPQLEARLNEIKEGINAGHTLREVREMPTVKDPGLDIAA